MKLLVAGGGTGGHLYPGLAVADEVKRRGGQVMFVGTARGLEARVVPAAGYPLELLEVSGLKRVGAAGMVRGLARVPSALGRSLGILRRFRPDVVLGVGGYASGPMMMAAALGRYPSAIQEQNSVPGFTNKTLGKFVHLVITAFDEAAAFFPARKVRLLGNPVRRSFVEGVTVSGAVHDEQRVLVVGGSQGARAVNELVLGAAALLAKQGRLPRLVHQTGTADLDRCRARYAELDGGAGETTGSIDVRSFIDDMARAYGDADLVIGRAGALTLAELAVVGRPAILVPLPTAADDHQRKNAEAFARAGAAVVVEQTTADATALARLVAQLLDDADRRTRMAAAMRGLAKPGAAGAIVDALASLAKRRAGPVRVA